MGMFNTKIGGEPGDVVPADRYLAWIHKASATKSKSGTHGMKLDVVVRQDGEKKKVSFWIYFQRDNGTKIRIGCDTIQAVGEAVGVADPADYGPADIEGNTIGLDLDVEESGGHKPKNVIVDVLPVFQKEDKTWKFGESLLAKEPEPEDTGPPSDYDDDSDIPF